MQSFLDEAFPLQIARQWWGNTLTPATFHDTWLSAGFASFSTSIYDLQVYLKPDSFREHWNKARERVLVTNRSGVKANEQGPVWMGILNDTYRTPGNGAALAEAKGGYIVQMLRSLMWDPATGDTDFRTLLQDYMNEFRNQAVSTESFKYAVEKHIKGHMDVDRNGRMDWFFAEWVYGTDVPSYKLEYSLATGPDGKPLLDAKLTQYGVSPNFRMPVPVFAELSGRKVRVGVVVMAGNTTREFKVTLPEHPKKVLLNLNYDILTDKEEVRQIK